MLYETLGRKRAFNGGLEDLLGKRSTVEGRLLDLQASIAEAPATSSASACHSLRKCAVQADGRRTGVSVKLWPWLKRCH